MSMTRRAVIVGTAAAAVKIGPRVAFAEAALGPFTVPPLPYATNSLEPHIDARTMGNPS